MSPPPPPDFQLFFEQGPGAYLVLAPDAHFTIVAVSNPYLRSTMTQREAIVGRPVFEVFPDNPAALHTGATRNLRCSLERVRATRAPDAMAVQRYDIREPASEGGGFQLRYWSPLNTPLLSPEGEVRYILHRVEDITAQVLARQHEERERAVLEAREHEALAQAEAERQKLRDIFLQAPVAICILEGPRHTFSFANPPYLELVTHRDIIGKPLLEALPELAEQGFDRVLDRVVATGEPFVGQAVQVKLAHHVEGEFDYMNFVYQPKRNARGEVDGVLVCAFEVTEQVLAHQRVETLRAQAEDAVRLRDEFLSVAAHELRTPLTSLKLQHQLIERHLDPESREAVSTRFATVRRQVSRLTSLVESLLDVSRIASGRLALELSDVDLLEVVRDALDRLKETFEQVGSCVRLHADGPVVGRWDALRLDQVVVNLLTNAVKYGAGKPVEVSVSAEEGRARLQVRDEGIGITPEALGRIFERFERGVSDRHYGGLGLGLYIARQIVEAMGGHIHVASTAGRGACFSVELPR